MRLAAGTPDCPIPATHPSLSWSTDAVQVLDGCGYTRDFRVERYMR
jgi:alkylation response protein AidB-like acyl-CoA dehydrogenase